MDLTINPVNSQTLTVADLLKILPAVCDRDANADVTRYIQKGFFELLWKRCEVVAANPHMVTYATIGHLAQRVLMGATPFSKVFKELKERPVLGLIKARNHMQDDVRFILTVIKNQTTLLLENCAIDNQMRTVYVYDKDEDFFIDSPHGQLMAHVTTVGWSI